FVGLAGVLEGDREVVGHVRRARNLLVRRAKQLQRAVGVALLGQYDAKCVGDFRRIGIQTVGMLRIVEGAWVRLAGVEPGEVVENQRVFGILGDQQLILGLCLGIALGLN